MSGDAPASEIETLRRELAEARRQQMAMSEALEAVAQSGENRDATFRGLLRTAARLCEADHGGVWLVEGDQLVGTVRMSDDPDENAFIKGISFPLSSTSSINVRSVVNGEVLQVSDLHDGSLQFTALRDRFKARSALNVPIMLNGVGVGLFALLRDRPSVFTEAQIALVRGFAAQAAIVVRNVRQFEALEARTAELNESLRQQTATAETLKTLSRSAFDLDAVLNTLVDSGVSLCGASTGGIAVRNGEKFQLRSIKGYPPETEKILRDRIHAPGRESVIPRVLLSGKIEMIPDGELDPEFVYPGPGRGFNRSFLGAPLLRDGDIIGVFVLGRRRPGGFTEREIELIKTFADQAVIAISNVNLFKDLEARTAELNEALEQQTATAETLKTLSRFTFDLDAVLSTLAQSAMRLCNADTGALALLMDGEFRMRTTIGYEPNFERFLKERRFVPGRDTMISRVLLSRSVEIVADSVEDRELLRISKKTHRSLLGVPLIRGDEITGVFTLRRTEPGGFSEREIELVKTYADQAIIAIGNVQLFKDLEARTAELNEALEQQTATAETLKTLSRSVFDLDAVLNTLLESAVRLCNGELGGLVVRADGAYRMRATVGFDERLQRWAREKVFTPDRSTVVSRVLLSGAVEMLVDLQDDPEIIDRGLMSARSIVGVPLRRSGDIEGVFVLSKLEPVGFTEREIELVKTYADQAVIAIGNVNLFKELEARTAELNEALEQQTATAETLKTLSRSVFDLDAVLNTLVESAVALCGAESGGLIILVSGEYRMRAHIGFSRAMQELSETTPITPGPESVVSRSLLSGEIEHVVDSHKDMELMRSLPSGIQMAHRTLLSVPLLQDSEIVGAILLRRFRPGGFTERQIDMVKTFADQAVIAIRNAQLFKDLEARTAELNEALGQQTATAETLKTLSRSVFDLDAVLNTLVKSAVALFDAHSGGLTLLVDGEYRMRANIGYGDALQAFFRDNVSKPGRETMIGRVLLSQQVEQIRDTGADGELRRIGDPAQGPRSLLGVPLFRDGALIGGMVVRRREPGGFSAREIELAQTYADQAVIAIGNAQLFKDLEARTEELRRSLAELRATQDRLIQTEKLASLGQLTAGVAHEIKNPLNFVNNFSKLSVELLEELGDALRSAALAQSVKDEVEDIARTLTENLEKIRHHGQRADSIVKNMLLHARQDGGERRAVDLNALIEESLNLAYHGARAERRDFAIALSRDLDPTVGPVSVFPQELTRVLLNLFSNGFYAAVSRAGEPGFTPSLRVSTRALEDRIEIRVRDNGKGVPDAIRDKLFTPFFTTKPAGEGTGLGLSLSYDIIVKQHGGLLTFESEAGHFTEFLISLPRGESLERAL